MFGICLQQPAPSFLHILASIDLHLDDSRAVGGGFYSVQLASNHELTRCSYEKADRNFRKSANLHPMFETHFF